MDAFLWVAAAILAAVFLVAGVTKVLQSKDVLVRSGQGWAEGFPEVVIKAVGILEVLAALGLVLPAMLGVAPFLVPLAATGIVLLEIGAAVVHARQRKALLVAVNLSLAALALVVAIQRTGAHAF